MKTVRNEKGFVLLLVYTIVLFVSIFSAVFFTRHRGAIQATERYQNRILAFNAAEAGIDFALRELATSNLRRTQTATDTYTSAYTPLTQNEFQYTVSPVSGKPTFRRIDSKGCAPSCDETAVTNAGSTIRAYQTSSITVFCQITEPAPPPSLFQYGIYATNSISLSGDKTSGFDSYNSNQGAYGGSNVSSAGAIATASTAIESISLKNTTVNGSALVGDEGNPGTGIKLQHATITGQAATLPDDWELAGMPPLPETYTEIDLSNVTGTLAPLPAGNYHCTSIKISGGGTVPTSGVVKIYVEGSIDIAGNGITVPENHPGNLTLFATGSVSVKVAGNGSFYGGIFAPNSAVTANGNGDIFGAIVSKSFETIGNSAVHFDLAMKENQPVDPNQTNIVRITAWQEMNSLAWGAGA